MTRLFKTLLIFAGTVLIAVFIGKYVPGDSSKYITIVISLVALLINLPAIKNWLEKPEITFTLITPKEDKGKAYWHLLIKNKGGAVYKGRLVLTNTQISDEEVQVVPFVRFDWPHGDHDKNLVGIERSIVKSQYVDLFSSRKGGELCLAHGHADGDGNSLIPIPRKADQSLLFSVQLIGENYQSPKDEWFCLTKTDTSWNIEKKVPNCSC